MFKNLLAVSLLMILTTLVTIAEETVVVKTKIAVLDFQNIGEKDKESQLGVAVAENLRTSLIDSNQYQVIERSALAKIMEEQRLQSTGIIDQSKAVEIGKLAGAEKMVMGSITKIGDTYTLNVRFIDVTTGVANLAKKIEGRSQNDIPAMIDEVVRILTKNETVTKVSTSSLPPTSASEKTNTSSPKITAPTKENKQISFGAKLGFASTNPNLTDNLYKIDSIEPKSSFVFGGILDYKLNDSFSLQPEFLFISKGGSMTFQTTITELYSPSTGGYAFYTFDMKTTFNTNYLELPVLAKWTYFSSDNIKASLLVGPYLSVLLNSSVELNAKNKTLLTEGTSKVDAFKFKSTDFGLVLGADIKFGQWVIDLRGESGGVVSDDVETEMKPSTGTLSLGYIF